jgi:hypothetical protein
MSLRHILWLLTVSFTIAQPAAADPLIVFSLQGIPFCTGGEPTGCGVTPFLGSEFIRVSVTGVGTPANSGVTVQGGGGGFSWIPGQGTSDSNNWYFRGTDIIIEAGFSFSGSFFIQPGDIPPMFYSLIGESQPFSIAKDGSPLQFSAAMTIGIDPRLAAFYGLAPPCLVDPFSLPAVDTCVNPNPYSFAMLSAIGTPADVPGLYTFSGQVTAPIVPEPTSAVCLAPVLIGCAWVITRKKFRAARSQAASGAI